MHLTPLEKDVFLAVNGDIAARARVSREIVPIIERQLSRFRLSPEDRLDVLQNTLLRVHQRLEDYRGDARFTTWLFRLTANEALMMLRKERRHRTRIGPDEVDLDTFAAPVEDDTVWDPRFDEQWLRNAWNGLPDHYRDVLQARYREDLPLEQIAVSMQTTESSVRSRLHRARARLRTLLGDMTAPLDTALPSTLGLRRPSKSNV